MTIASFFKLVTIDTAMISIPSSAFNIMTTTNNKQQPTNDMDNS